MVPLTLSSEHYIVSTREALNTKILLSKQDEVMSAINDCN